MTSADIKVNRVIGYRMSAAGGCSRFLVVNIMVKTEAVALMSREPLDNAPGTQVSASELSFSIR